jgi:hypothetical protein
MTLFTRKADNLILCQTNNAEDLADELMSILTGNNGFARHELVTVDIRDVNDVTLYQFDITAG